MRVGAGNWSGPRNASLSFVDTATRPPDAPLGDELVTRDAVTAAGMRPKADIVFR
jgi:hypothetical protein